MSHQAQSGQALTEFVISAILFFLIIMGTLFVARQGHRRFSEEMAIKSVAFSAATFSAEERRRWGHGVSQASHSLAAQVKKTLSGEPGFREASPYRIAKGCEEKGPTLDVETTNASDQEAQTLRLGTCARDTGDMKSLHPESRGVNLRREGTAATAPYVPLQNLRWKGRGKAVARARHEAGPQESFRTGFAGTRENGAQATPARAENFNRDVFMSYETPSMSTALSSVRDSSQTAQAVACIAEACKATPHAACAGGVALQLAASKLASTGQPSPLCPLLSRGLKVLHEATRNAAATRAKFVEAAERAAALEEVGGLALDKMPELE